jgi:hypothetical protein
MMDRQATWFIGWLAVDRPYTPQPYHQLANVMRAAGYPEKANTILYAGKQRELQEAWKKGNFWRAFGLQWLKWTIGFGLGYRFFRAVYWVLLLTLIGVLALQYSPTNLGLTFPAQFAFSLDQLLPIIKLDESHADISLSGWPCYYFYVHKIMGYILASFVVAGLAGVTRK